MEHLRWFVDRCTPAEIAGWIDEGRAVQSIDIEINGRWACSLSPTIYRVDLQKAGIGDGRRGFAFPLSGRLEPGENIIVMKLGDVRLYESRVIHVTFVDDPALHALSQRRWRGDEGAAGLTWGRVMTGDSLWDLYQKTREFRPTDKILEIGPGYGRLLRTAIERKIPFASYTAVDLSDARVQRLRNEFGDGNTHFIQGDIDSWVGDTVFDIVICSATFEHLHPDCRNALTNIRGQLSSQGRVYIDFLRYEANDYVFESTGTYVKKYSRETLVAIFNECGYDVRAIEICTVGEGDHGAVERFVVVADASA
jgi:SAM-dependent methyltransferase